MFLRIIIFVLTAAAAAQAGDLTVAAGAFRFQATDYYYPNFYEEAGFRGEVAYALGETNRHTFRLLLAGYPMDDNIFEPALEYAWRPAFGWGAWDIVLEPAAGFQYTKLQYPAPYFPTVEHNFMPFVRFGGDAGVGRHLVGALSFRGCYRGRALYYLGDTFFKNEDGKVAPFKYVHAPFAEASYAAFPKVTLLGRAGWEFGGYYDDIFLTPPDLPSSRPYFEAGFVINM